MIVPTDRWRGKDFGDIDLVLRPVVALRCVLYQLNILALRSIYSSRQAHTHRLNGLRVRSVVPLEVHAAIVDVRVQLEATLHREVVASVARPFLVDGRQEEAFLDFGMDLGCDWFTLAGHLGVDFEVGPREVATLILLAAVRW